VSIHIQAKCTSLIHLRNIHRTFNKLKLTIAQAMHIHVIYIYIYIYIYINIACHTCVIAIIQYQIKFFQAKLWKTKEQYFNLISYTNHSKFWKLRNKYFTEITLWKIQKQYLKLIFQTNHSKLWKITETITQITRFMKN
jgi:hypothetical protein